MMQSHTLFRQHLVSAYKGEEFKCINISGEGKKNEICQIINLKEKITIS